MVLEPYAFPSVNDNVKFTRADSRDLIDLDIKPEAVLKDSFDIDMGSLVNLYIIGLRLRTSQCLDSLLASGLSRD
jgi:hypothetical protein